MNYTDCLYMVDDGVLSSAHEPVFELELDKLGDVGTYIGTLSEAPNIHTNGPSSHANQDIALDWANFLSTEELLEFTEVTVLLKDPKYKETRTNTLGFGASVEYDYYEATRVNPTDGSDMGRYTLRIYAGTDSEAYTAALMADHEYYLFFTHGDATFGTPNNYADSLYLVDDGAVKLTHNYPLFDLDLSQLGEVGTFIMNN